MPHAQPQEHRSRYSARSADRHHRPVGLGQVVARVRHDLRRGAAPLRRVAVGLRAAVPRGWTSPTSTYRGAFAGDRDRAEDDVAQPALHGRHCDRDLRLPAAALRARRHRTAPSTARSCRPDTCARWSTRCSRARGQRASASRAVSGAKVKHVERARELRGRASCACASTARRRSRRPARAGSQAASTSIDAVVDRLRAPDADAAARGIVRDGAAARATASRAIGFADATSASSSVLRALRVPDCGTASRARAAPVLVQQPGRRLPDCDGLGVQEFFDTCVVVHPELSLPTARSGWDRRNAYYFELIQSLAAHDGFDIETPWSELPEARQTRAARGQRRRADRVPLRRRARRRYEAQHRFEGIVPNLERRYRETESVDGARGAREVPRTRPCADCDGTRLKAMRATCSSAGTRCPAIAAARSPGASRFSASSRSTARAARSRSASCKESPPGCAFLRDVGLDYLSLDRSAETLSGGEAQRIRLASQIGSGLVGVMYILDEPSIGLHQRDNPRLLARSRGCATSATPCSSSSTTRRRSARADHMIDLGPGAAYMAGASCAGHAARDRRCRARSPAIPLGAAAIPVPARRRAQPDSVIRMRGARGTTCKTST